jgi:hypothetical protein
LSQHPRALVLACGTRTSFEQLWKDREEYEARAGAEQQAPDDWRNSIFDPWADLEPPPAGVLRPDYEATLRALAKRDGCDLGALCVAYITAVSGAAHKDMRFAPFQHGEWQVPPIIYVMVVSDPGFRKSVLISAAFAALWRRDKEEWNVYQVAVKDGSKLEEPAPLIVTDVSMEKLQAILARSPRGALVLRDEIAPLFDFRHYARGNGAVERAFFLTAYEGGETRVHRISRATDRGEPTGVTVVGGIRIERLVDFTELGNDGLMQHFIPIVIARHNLTEPDVAVHGKHLPMPLSARSYASATRATASRLLMDRR